MTVLRRPTLSVVEWVVIGSAMALGVGFAWSALSDARTFDAGLAYSGGATAWRTGHPEDLPTWIGTPFLAFLMGITSRAASDQAAAAVITLINIALVGILIGVTWMKLRVSISRVAWAVSLLLAVAYAPAISCALVEAIQPHRVRTRSWGFRLRAPWAGVACRRANRIVGQHQTHRCLAPFGPIDSPRHPALGRDERHGRSRDDARRSSLSRVACARPRHAVAWDGARELSAEGSTR